MGRAGIAAAIVMTTSAARTTSSVHFLEIRR
jgi:hypothetical protein